jgi:hypothetical protein
LTEPSQAHLKAGKPRSAWYAPRVPRRDGRMLGLVEIVVRPSRTNCPVCNEPFAKSRSVLFQGDQLVHAACWRDDHKPFDATPPAG